MRMVRLEQAKNPMVSMQEAVMLNPRGHLSVTEGQELLGHVLEEIGDRPRDVIVDFSGEEDVSSWCFALVCGLGRRLALSGNRLRIAGAAPSVRGYVEMLASPAEPVEFHDGRKQALREARGRFNDGGRRSAPRARRAAAGRPNVVDAAECWMPPRCTGGRARAPGAVSVAG